MEEFHGEVDAFAIAAFDGEVARLGCAGAEDDGVEVRHELLGGDVFADFGVAAEGDAFALEQADAAHDDFVFIELHVWDAIHEQAAGTVGALEDGDPVAGFVELSSGAQARGSGADDGDFFTGAGLGRLGEHPAFFPAVIDDGDLDVFDGHRRVVHAEHARAFARCGADASGELREVVRLVQSLQGFLPKAAVDEVVPLGDEVVDRASAGHAADEGAAVAEWNAAVHATRRLLLELRLVHVFVEFIPVVDACDGAAVERKFAREFKEASWFAHSCLFVKVCVF